MLLPLSDETVLALMRHFELAIAVSAIACALLKTTRRDDSNDRR